MADSSGSYGDSKGACEMIFSYGFLEELMVSAKELLLDLQIPDDDPLRVPKSYCSTVAPGVKLYEPTDGSPDCKWHSDYVWLICVNEEDGLDFVAAQKTDGGRDLHVLWTGEKLHETAELEARLKEHHLWNVFQLRAVSIIQERVAAQIEALKDHANHFQDVSVQNSHRILADKLRKLEAELLHKAYGSLELQVSKRRKLHLRGATESATSYANMTSMASRNRN